MGVSQDFRPVSSHHIVCGTDDEFCATVGNTLRCRREVGIIADVYSETQAACIEDWRVRPGGEGALARQKMPFSIAADHGRAFYNDSAVEQPAHRYLDETNHDYGRDFWKALYQVMEAGGGDIQRHPACRCFVGQIPLEVSLGKTKQACAFGFRLSRNPDGIGQSALNVLPVFGSLCGCDPYDSHVMPSDFSSGAPYPKRHGYMERRTAATSPPSSLPAAPLHR